MSVGSFVSGPIKDILVNFNDKVTKNQVLARIDPRLSKASYDREKAAFKTMEADLDRITAQLKLAKRNEERAENLRKTNKDYISQQELDQLSYAVIGLEAQRKLSLANIEAAQAGVDNAKTNLDFTEVISPVDGIVIERKVEPGQTVASTFQTPELFIIAPDLDTMHVLCLGRRGGHRPDSQRPTSRATGQVHRGFLARRGLYRQDSAGAHECDDHAERRHLSGHRRSAECQGPARRTASSARK